MKGFGEGFRSGDYKIALSLRCFEVLCVVALIGEHDVTFISGVTGASAGVHT